MIGSLFPTGHGRGAAALGAIVLILAGWLHITIDGSSPEPQPSTVAATDFSSARAMDTVRTLADQPRPIGSEASDETFTYLSDELDGLGFTVESQSEIGMATFGNQRGFGQVDNIVATKEGTDPTGQVILVAHYDSVPAGPGAADAASAVASVVEVVRAIDKGDPLRNDLVVLFTDGEESGLLGAEAYTRDNPPEQPTVVLNLEARGSSGASVMFETSRDNYELAKLFTETAPVPRGDSSTVEIYRTMPNDTDFTRFLESGYAGLNSAFVESPEWYHTPGDSVEHLDEASLQHHGDNTLALTQALGGTDLTSMKSDHDAVYFHLFGFQIVYSAQWALAPGILAAIALFAAILIGRAQRLLSLPRLLGAVASFPVPILLSFGIGWGSWKALSTLRPDFVDSGGLVYHPVVFTVMAVILALVSISAWYLLLRRRLGGLALSSGVLTWMTVAAILSAVTMPGISFLTAVPAMTIAIAFVIALVIRRRRVDRPGVRWTAVGLVTLALVPAVAIYAWTGWSTLTLFGVPGLDIAVPMYTLAFAVMIPLFDSLAGQENTPLSWRWNAGIPAALLTVGVAVAAVGIAVNRYDESEPQRTHLSYVQSGGTAFWVTTDRADTDWSRRFASREGTRSGVPEAYDAYGSITRSSPTPAVDLLPPEYDIVDASAYKVTVRLTAQRDVNHLGLSLSRSPGRITADYGDGEPVTIEADDETDADTTIVRFFDPPEDGVTVTLDVPLDSITVFDSSVGLEDVPGFEPRPEGIERQSGSHSDTIVLMREVKADDEETNED
ncbi:M28 family peptidase [Haloglycomyces albus]|uniref:M28 family peptidase n=1 Tax=Haloglycomyces albus TaxID=526067 RepID=UPI00046D120B|nr:M28 family peptidase [Haloglycomyces albus]